MAHRGEAGGSEPGAGALRYRRALRAQDGEWLASPRPTTQSDRGCPLEGVPEVGVLRVGAAAAARGAQLLAESKRLVCKSRAAWPR